VLGRFAMSAPSTGRPMARNAHRRGIVTRGC
jgi:hypothetical protein